MAFPQLSPTLEEKESTRSDPTFNEGLRTSTKEGVSSSTALSLVNEEKLSLINIWGSSVSENNNM